MSHPSRYRPDDPLLHRVRQICLALPGALEKDSHGRPVFYTTKIFALYGAMVKGDRRSTDFARSVVVLPDPAEREALLADERFFVPAYYGAYGWLGLNLGSGRPDWREVTELVDASYRNTAGQRLVAELDARA